MKVKAKARWIKISPRKLMRVLDSIRGMAALQAMQTLKFMPQKGARILEKVIRSAVANAKNNYKLAEEALVVSEAFVNKGITMKRWKTRAKGRVNTIFKRGSHVTVCVSTAQEKEAVPEETKEAA